MKSRDGGTDPSPVAYRLALAAVTACALLAIWVPRWPVGTDTPTHMAHAALLAHPDRAADLLVRSVALTSQLFVVAAAPLTLGFSLVVAAKLALSGLLVVSMCGAWVLGRSAGSARPPGPLFAAVATTSGFFAVMGFDNFALGAALGCLLLPAALAWRSGQRPLQLAVFSLLGLLVAYAHIIAFGMCALFTALAVFTVKRQPDTLGTCATDALKTALALTPAGLFALASVYLTYSAQSERGVTEGLGVQRLPFSEQLENLVALPFGATTSLGLALTALGLVFLAQSRKRIWLVAALFLPLYFLVPWHMPGWAFAQPRVLVPLFLLPLFCVGWGRFPRVGLAALSILACAVPIAGLRSSVPVAETIDAAVVAMGDTAPGRTMTVRLGNGATPALRWSEPLLHADDWVLAAGGATPSALDLQPFIHSLLPRYAEWPPAPPMYLYRSLDCSVNPDCSVAPRQMVDRAALQGLAFDTVLVTPPDAAFTAALERRGYVAVHPSRFRPRPSSLRVQLDVQAEAAHGEVTIVVAYPDSLGPIATVVIPSAPAAQIQTIPIGPLPAGRTYIEITSATGEGAVETLLSRTLNIPPGEVLEIRVPSEDLP